MELSHESLSVDHLLIEKRKFAPPAHFQMNAHINSEKQYQELYKRSVEDPNGFWLEQSKTLSWFEAPTLACRYVWDSHKRHVEHTWFEDGKINVTSNCLDRHLTTPTKLKPAIIWQGENDAENSMLTYEELYYNVCKFANVLKSSGIEKGDRVCIYMPMIPEIVIAMLACARIGAIHNVVFGGFSSEALMHRINDSGCKLLITSNVSIRNGKKIFLKEMADLAIQNTPSIEKVIVAKRTEENCPMQKGRDSWWNEEMLKANESCAPEILNAEDPLFILYTSGSTGKPKGVVHTQGGYLLHAALTHRYIFDIHEEDIYWCTADCGWITGHSYVVYGPLANGATTLIFEGTPTYPDAGRFWQVIDKHQVNILYTAPTAIRALISHGDEFPKKYKLSSLQLLGTVGEPINPEAWIWYHEKIGKNRCPIVDTWWQTETGGIMICSLPGAHQIKPGCAGRPFFGIEPVILRDDGSECEPGEGGSLCIKHPWPGIMRTTWGDHARFIENYFSKFNNYYFTGDGCFRDKDGDYWLMGRIDDVVNVSGHRIGTAEVESALVSHPHVAEAAVVGIPHPIKGQSLCAFITLVEGTSGSSEMKYSLAQHVKKEIGSIAVPEKMQFAKALPKTRSGKIMRRLLRKIASNDQDLGDISTLADGAVLEALKQQEED